MGPVAFRPTLTDGLAPSETTLFPLGLCEHCAKPFNREKDQQNQHIKMKESMHGLTDLCNGFTLLDNFSHQRTANDSG